MFKFNLLNQVSHYFFYIIFIQFLFIGMIDDHLEAPLVENLAQKIADEQGAYKGNLRVYLISAKDLVKADDGVKKI